VRVIVSGSALSASDRISQSTRGDFDFDFAFVLIHNEVHDNYNPSYRKMRPDGARESIVGPYSGPEAPFPLKLGGEVIKGFGRGSKEVRSFPSSS